MSQPYLLILEDHPMVAQSIELSLAALQSTQPSPWGVVTVGNFAQVKRLIARDGAPQLLLTDLNLPDSNGVATVVALRQLAPNAPIVVFSVLDNAMTQQAVLHAGADAVISKSVLASQFIKSIQPFLNLGEQGLSVPSTISKALGKPKTGLSRLTHRQQEVLAQLAAGYSNKEIALKLGIGEHTVRSHVTDLLRLLGVLNRTQASAIYTQWLAA